MPDRRSPAIADMAFSDDRYSIRLCGPPTPIERPFIRDAAEGEPGCSIGPILALRLPGRVATILLGRLPHRQPQTWEAERQAIPPCRPSRGPHHRDQG